MIRRTLRRVLAVLDALRDEPDHVSPTEAQVDQALREAQAAATDANTVAIELDQLRRDVTPCPARNHGSACLSTRMQLRTDPAYWCAARDGSFPTGPGCVLGHPSSAQEGA